MRRPSSSTSRKPRVVISPTLRDLALEHGVGGRGGAVDDEVEVARGNARRVDGGEDGGGAVATSVGILASLTRRAVRPSLVEQQVGERAADVDAGDAARFCGSHLRAACPFGPGAT